MVGTIFRLLLSFSFREYRYNICLDGEFKKHITKEEFRVRTCLMCSLLTYMDINIDFDDNKPHVLIKQTFINCAFIIRK